LNIIIIICKFYNKYLYLQGIMPQLTIHGKEVYDLPTDVVSSLGGNQGGVRDGKHTDYSTIFQNIDSLAYAMEIVRKINVMLQEKEKVTSFYYNHEHKLYRE
jgi:hypothetical protein